MSTEDSGTDVRASLTTLKENVMTGVSFMIPFVTIGGIFLAAGYALAGIPGFGTTVQGIFDANGTIPWFLAQMGTAGLTIMVPILGGYIAYAIADRPGLAPGFLLSYIIQQGVVVQESGNVLGLPAGQAAAGYLGALVAGLAAGYVARWIKSWNVPSMIEPMMPILIVPIGTVVILFLPILFLVGVPVAIANAELTNILGGMQGSAAAAILGLIVGAMMAFDMGGPVNKVAYVFSVGLIAQGVTEPMAAVMIAGMVPPLGMALSNFYAPQKYPAEMYEQAKSSVVLGLSFITEGAIPYAASDPFRVIPSLMAGSGVAAALSMFLGVGIRAPHGGIFVVWLANPIWGFLVSLLVGTLVTAVLITLLKPDYDDRVTDADEASAQIGD